jgi:hypothetical protein
MRKTVARLFDRAIMIASLGGWGLSWVKYREAHNINLIAIKMLCFVPWPNGSKQALLSAVACICLVGRGIVVWQIFG